MYDDPIVSEVRRVREELSKQFDYDLHKMFADLRKREQSLGPRLVQLQRKPAPESNHVPYVDDI